MKTTLIKALKAIFLPVVVYCVFLMIAFGRFSNPNSIYTIFLQSIIPTITAYAVAFGYMCGIFDFTIGSRIIISGLVGGIMSSWLGLPGLIIGCFAASIILSIITGLLNWVCRIPSLVLTMALTMIFEIIGKNIAGKFSFVSIDYKYAALGASPYIIYVLAFSAIVFYFLFGYTKFSYHMRAVGSDEVVAKNTGIKTQFVKFMSFVIGSIFIAIAAVLTISQSGSMGAQTGLGSATLIFKPLMGIMIAIVLQPLCNMTFGILISQLTLNTIFIGLIAAGLPDTFQNISLGFFLLVVMIISNNISGSKRLLARLRVPFTNRTVTAAAGPQSKGE